MATIAFLAGSDFTINNLSASGLGFYYGGFGNSVPVGSYQTRTFITDSTGTSQNAEVDNVQYLNAGSGIIGQAGSGVSLRSIPNYLSTLNLRFTHGSSVQTQNAKLYISDRTNILNSASGVDAKIAYVVHPNTTQGPTGSGSTAWFTPASGNYLVLPSSPGVSGLSPNGTGTSAVQHDWYTLISCSPSSTGAKEFMATLTLEYL